MITPEDCQQALAKHKGNKSAAAEELGIPRTTFRRYLAKADSLVIKGTSTLYDEEGNVKLTWVKESTDQKRRDEAFKVALQGFADKLPRVKPTKFKGHASQELMACYPIGDHHFGMLAWHEETGADFNLDIAEELLVGAINHLVDISPRCNQAVLAILGDFLHYDSMEAVTPTSHNMLDSDSRFPKIVRVAIRAIRQAIKKCLVRHNNVRVIVEIGNHDLSSSIFLATCLANIYEDEPRVTIDDSPKHFHYIEFGKVLIGTHHGHGVKLQDLPLLMATHMPEAWGVTSHRYWWTGHVHHDQVKEYNGVKVESMRILPPADAYAANKGYCTGRDMKGIIIHQEHGEVARHLVTPEMLT